MACLAALTLGALGCGTDALPDESRSASEALDPIVVQNDGQGTRIADGYDALSGQVLGTCFTLSPYTDPAQFNKDPQNAHIQSYPLYGTEDDLKIVRSKAELASKLGLEVNAQVGGKIKGVDLGTELRSNLVRETAVNDSTITVVLRFAHAVAYATVYGAQPSFRPDMLALLKKDPLLFRSQCGDGYISSVTVGAGLYMTFQAEKVDKSSLTKSDMTAAVNAGFESIFKASSNTSLTKEQKESLSGYKISIKCKSEGLSSDICLSGKLPEGSIDLNEESIRTITTAVGNLKQAVTNELNEVKDGKKLSDKLVTISQVYTPYQVPIEMGNRPASSVFFDERPYRNSLNGWMALEEKVKRACKGDASNTVLCDGLLNQISAHIDNCALQRNLASKQCMPPDRFVIPGVIGVKVKFDHSWITENIRAAGLDAKSKSEFTQTTAETAYRTIAKVAKDNGERPYNVLVYRFDGAVPSTQGLENIVYEDTFKYGDTKYRLWAFEKGTFTSQHWGYDNWCMFASSNFQDNSPTREVRFSRPNLE